MECVIYSVLYLYVVFLWYFVLFMLISPLHKAACKRNVKQCLMFLFVLCMVF